MRAIPSTVSIHTGSADARSIIPSFGLPGVHVPRGCKIVCPEDETERFGFSVFLSLSLSSIRVFQGSVNRRR